MENNNNIIRKFYCDVCGSMIKQDCILLGIRCDKCSFKPINRNDEYDKIKMVSNDTENKKLRDL